MTRWLGPLVERRTLSLLVLTGGLAGLEALILQGVSFDSALPLAPQISSPAPFSIFHDLRWVWTYDYSPWSAVWMLVLLFLFQTPLNALLVGLAWPKDRVPPRYPVLLRRSALFTLLAGVALSPWATLTFMAAAVGFSPLMLAAIIGSGITVLVLPPGIITGEWWRKILPLRSMGWILLSWVELMLASLAITFSPPWVTVLVAIGGGVFNGWVWQRIVGAVVVADPPRWTVPAMPIIAVAVSAALLFGAGFVFSGSLVGGGSSQTPSIGGTVSAGAPPVIYVAGFDSNYGGGPVQVLPSGFDTVQFSYRGLGSNGNPLPYRAVDTHQALAVSARRLAAQIEALHQQAGQPVAVVAQSEGTMVARAYFAMVTTPPVNTFVQFSPLIRPSRVYYPEAGKQGFGYLASWEARGIFQILHLESAQNDLSASMPFVRSLVTNAPLYRDQTLCPIPSVRTFLFLPLEGALTVYRGPLTNIPWTTLPGYHATLLNDRSAQNAVANILTGGELHHRGWEAAFQIIRGAAGAWQSPALPLGAHPGWSARPNSDPAFGHWACPATSATG